MKKYLPQFIILLLLVLILLLSRTIVRLENFHYASWAGFCYEKEVVYAENLEAIAERNRCLENTQTRTSNFSHLFYALTD